MNRRQDVEISGDTDQEYPVHYAIRKGDIADELPIYVEQAYREGEFSRE